MGRSGNGNDRAPDMSERDLAELVARVWERAGYPTAVERHEDKTFVVAGTAPEAADLLWVVPANEKQKLAAAWIDVYEAILDGLQFGQPYLVTTGEASDEAERAAERSNVVLVDRGNLETLLRQSGIGTERLEAPTSTASPSPGTPEESAPADETASAKGVADGTGGDHVTTPEESSVDTDSGTAGAATGTSARDETATADAGGVGTGLDETGDASEDLGAVGGGGGGGGDGGGMAMTFDDDGGVNDLSDSEDSGGGGDGGGMAMTFDDDGGVNDLSDSEDSGGGDDGGGMAMTFGDDGEVNDLSGGAGSGGAGSGGAGSGGAGSSGSGSSGLDSILEKEEETVPDASDDSTSRRRFAKVGFGVIGMSVLGIVDRIWLHFVLGGGGGGLPSYNETRVKQQAQTIETGNLLNNADTLVAEDQSLPVTYEGVVMNATDEGGYQRLEVRVQSGDRNLLARWDGDALRVGDQITLWGAFVGTETVETETGSTEYPLVDVVSVSVSGGATTPASGTTTEG